KDSKTIKTADFEGVKSIGAEAFANSSLETITNADDLTSIKGSAFHSSAIVEFKSNMDFNITSSSTRVFYGCKNLKTFFAPQFNLWNTLYIFQNCTALEKVVVQAGQIGTSNFSGCTSLTALVIHQYQNSIATLSGGVNALSDTPIANGTGYIYVPKALIEQYKVATNWINFADQFRAIEDYPEICGGGTQ
ncbi:MAG: leucine-rich repeat protein, partial [Oscillospiraceae bacterium]|nr:leucine-rich repeat protein [Oscillospiraceae bacterium]